MAAFREINSKYFPLKNIYSIVQLFIQQLQHKNEPDLALLSIVVGIVENSLTSRIPGDKESNLQSTVEQTSFPVVEFDTVESLYNKFTNIVKGAVDLKGHKGKYASREIVKRVSDVIWNSLTRSYYKDRAHLQSLYSYLVSNKLDCFGVAFAVVAGCQALGFNDVHLTMSEDHAWVVFGQNGTETAEVTWHGKGTEDKRGQSVTSGIQNRSWLYLAGHVVKCSRFTEVAALVSAINPSLNVTSEAHEVALLQQELLWLLYDMGQLDCYPMAIGNLGELEECFPRPGKPNCLSLFQQAVNSARQHYNNHHVYPYTYLGGYYYRHNMYKEAFGSWADAGDVIKLYNYSRDDEEIYKEFMEIANELIPHIMKAESSGHSARSILKDPQCFAHLIRFYDGICKWEECSPTPILHIGWAKPLVNAISKFDADVRSQVLIICKEEDIEDTEIKQEDNKRIKLEEDKKNIKKGELDLDENVSKEVNKGKGIKNAEIKPELIHNNNNHSITRDKNGSSSTSKDTEDKSETKNEVFPGIRELTAACSEKILNPHYLLQGGDQPFESNVDEVIENDKCDIEKNDAKEKSNEPSAVASTSNEPSPIKMQIADDLIDDEICAEMEKVSKSHPQLILYSQKMKGLKDLLLADKLNTHAISLQLTAQSQVQVKKGRGEVEAGVSTRAKRSRRD